MDLYFDLGAGLNTIDWKNDSYLFNRSSLFHNTATVQGKERVLYNLASVSPQWLAVVKGPK